jgi:hypothetical protein
MRFVRIVITSRFANARLYLASPKGGETRPLNDAFSEEEVVACEERLRLLEPTLSGRTWRS